jgi:hypothetical protein
MSPGSNRHESLIAPETIDVEECSVMLDDNSHTNSGNSSPDELNILSLSTEGTFSSKYAFGTSSHGSTVWNNNPPIAPDGENTKWAKNKYNVKEKVANFEAKNRTEDQPNRIDLRTRLRTKEKMKTKVCLLSHRAG